MAFSTVSASATSSEVSYTTSHTVTLPASNSGDILVFFMNCENSAGTGLTLTGWTEVQGEYGASGISDNYVWAKVSSGSEPATVAVTSATSCSSATVCLTIIDSEGTLNALEFATFASGNSTGPDSATLTPSWGSADTMWISVANLRRGRTVTTYPYADNNLYISTGTSNGDPAVALCSDEIASVTVDPAAYLISASTNWYAMTMAVEPAAAAGITLTAPDTAQEGVTATATGTALDTVATFTVQTDDSLMSFTQTMDTQSTGTITYGMETGINDVTIGVGTGEIAGIPLEPTVNAALVTAYQLEQKIVT